MGLYIPPPERALIVWHPASTPPAGYIKANGASLDTTVYAWLFSKIGYTFGGSGATFNAPDLRGEFLRGLDDGRGVDVGRGVGTAQSQDVQPHNHSYSQFQYSGGSSIGVGTATVNQAYYYGATTGSAGTTETRPRNVAGLYCIAYQP